MANLNEDWQKCANWLVRCKIIAADHRVLWNNAEVFELAQTLRDGVLICHLLNHLNSGSVDPRDFSTRPQMSQFLCVKNIRAFLWACQNKFDIKERDLFEPYDLFEVRNFGKVIHALSVLSQTPIAKSNNIAGFYASTTNYQIPGLAEDIKVEEDLYGCVYGTMGDDDPNEDIYTDIIYNTVSPTSKPPVSPNNFERTLTKRDYCVKELVDTEKNYVNALEMIVKNFINEMRHFELILPEYKETIFKHLELLHETHQQFYTELCKACLPGAEQSLHISEVFIKYKTHFIVYGDYCSNLPEAQNLVDTLCTSDAKVAEKIKECQLKANNNKFKLRDLLAVPMQRILKYSLLMRELMRETSNEQYKTHLTKGLEAMQDLSLYVNEYKRDHELLTMITEIQDSILSLNMPNQTMLKDYGRLLKDGELKVKQHVDGNTTARYVFLFDRVIMMCKAKGEQYKYKNAIVLNLYYLESEQPTGAPTTNRSRPWTSQFSLYEKEETNNVYTFYAKNEDTKMKWIEAISMAQDNTEPEGGTIPGICHFIMWSFQKPTPCDYCGKLLRGVFYQGYICTETKKNVHKECITKIVYCIAIRPYGGIPRPSEPCDILTFDKGTEIQLTYSDVRGYYMGKANGRRGLFPVDYVSVRFINELQQQEPQKPKYEPWVLPESRSVRKSSLKDIMPHRHSMDTDLTRFPWFTQTMSRQQANTVMNKFEDGTFLIRESLERRNQNALSIKFNGTVKHIKVVKEDMYYLASSKRFYSIPELVEYYQVNSLVDSFPELRTTLKIPFKNAVAPVAQYPDVCGYCTALFDYSANQPGQLSFKSGTVIAIISRAGGFRGWWKGRLQDRVGYFPSAYVAEEGDG